MDQQQQGSELPIRVVIPAYRSDDSLWKCIEALQRSTVSERMEIVVVDDGGNNLEHRFRSESIRTIINNRNLGPALSRNKGAASAQGLLVFLDSDVVVNDDTIEKLVAPIERGIAEATVGNYSMDVAGMHYAQKYKQLYISHVYRRRQGLLKNQFWTAIGAIRADVFQRLKGFRPVTQKAAGEDTDIGHRLTNAGYRVYAVPEATGIHLKDYTVTSILKNDLQKGTADFALALANRSRLTDHRHANSSDIGAVVLAYCMVLFALTGFALGFPYTVLPILVTGIYLFVRREFMLLFARQGLTFLLRSCALMFCLDIVRGICVLRGGLKFYTQPRKYIGNEVA